MAQGLGFAVPGDTARWVLTELIGHGRVRRLSLGLTAAVVPVPRRLARALDLLNDRAVQVIATTPGGPSDAAGLLAGDLIVTVNGRIVSGVDDLHRLLARLPWDRPVILGIVRDERLFDVAVELRLGVKQADQVADTEEIDEVVPEGASGPRQDEARGAIALVGAALGGKPVGDPAGSRPAPPSSRSPAVSSSAGDRAGREASTQVVRRSTRQTPAGSRQNWPPHEAHQRVLLARRLWPVRRTSGISVRRLQDGQYNRRILR